MKCWIWIDLNSHRSQLAVFTRKKCLSLVKLLSLGKCNFSYPLQVRCQPCDFHQRRPKRRQEVSSTRKVLHVLKKKKTENTLLEFNFPLSWNNNNKKNLSQPMWLADWWFYRYPFKLVRGAFFHTMTLTSLTYVNTAQLP